MAEATTAKTPAATILCVDDELNILSSMKRLFRPFGYRVLTADSGAKGLEIIDQENGNINVIISDMRMPNMNGAEFLASVRQKFPNIMRILLTGYSDMDSTVDAINDGQIYRYVSKPWNETDLISCIKEALKVQHLKTEKERLEKLTQEQNNQLKILNSSLEEKVAKRTADLRSANDRLKKNFLTSIKIFSSLIELRGGKVAGHSRRVAELARKIAVNMKLPIKEVNDIFLAGLLHDIGKIGFSDELLNKAPVKMSAEERKIFCEHPIKGEELLMPLEDMKGAAVIIRSHHEHFDGKGYPEKLAGKQIPIGSRILAVANEHDGLIEGYLTGKKQSGTEVYGYIHNNSGKRYDPEVVAVYEKLLWSGANSVKPPTATATTQVQTQKPEVSPTPKTTSTISPIPPTKVTPQVVTPQTITPLQTPTNIQEIDNAQQIIPLDEDVDVAENIPEVTLSVLGLKPGMKLSRDLFANNGTMLLAADFVLDEMIIRKLSHYIFQHRESNKQIYIYDPKYEEVEDIEPLEQDKAQNATAATPTAEIAKPVAAGTAANSQQNADDFQGLENI